jgi:hypothetical protein
MNDRANVILVGGIVKDILYGDIRAAEQIAIMKYGDPANEGPDGNLDLVTPNGEAITVQRAPVMGDDLAGEVEGLEDPIDELRHAVAANDHARKVYWAGQLLYQVANIVGETATDAAQSLRQ